MQEEAENALKEARKEAQAKVQAAKEATQAEQGKKLAEAKEVSTQLAVISSASHLCWLKPCDSLPAKLHSCLSKLALWQRPTVTIIAEALLTLLINDAYSCVLTRAVLVVVSQKLDQELEKALAALESERNDALSNLDSQVRLLCIAAPISVFIMLACCSVIVSFKGHKLCSSPYRVRRSRSCLRRSLPGFCPRASRFENSMRHSASQQSIPLLTVAQQHKMVLAYEKTLLTALRLVEINKQANV